MLELGDRISVVSVTTTRGEVLDLTEQRQGGGLLIYFMRTTTCPMCNRHVAELARHADAYAERGVSVIVAVPDDVTTAVRWAEAKQLPFPVVVGESSAPHASFGLARKVLGSMMQSGTILVDQQGVVRYADIVTMPVGGYSPRRVGEAIDRLPKDSRI